MKHSLPFIIFCVLAFSFAAPEDLAGIYKFDNAKKSPYASSTSITMTLNKDKTFLYEFRDQVLGSLTTTGKWESKKEKLFLYAEKEVDVIKTDSVISVSK